MQKLKISLTRRNNLLKEKDKRIEELEKKLQGKVFDEDESQKVIETGNRINKRGIINTSIIGKGVNKKVKKMNEIAKKLGRKIRLTNIEYPEGSKIFKIRVDNFDLGYAYVWDMEQLSERHSKCLRQKKTLSKVQLQSLVNTTEDPFWSEMEYVYLGQTRFDLMKDQNFLGDLCLSHQKKKGFLIMMEVNGEGNKMIMKVGKLKEGWVKIIKYYLKVEWQHKGHTQLKKLRSDMFDFPQKANKSKNRNDIYVHEFENIFKKSSSSRTIDRSTGTNSNLIIKAYGVIAAKRFFNDQNLFKSISDWNGEMKNTSVQRLNSGLNNDSFSHEKKVFNQKTNKKLNDQKPCCTIF
jgi:hypothetical protein